MLTGQEFQLVSRLCQAFETIADNLEKMTKPKKTEEEELASFTALVAERDKWKAEVLESRLLIETIEEAIREKNQL